MPNSKAGACRGPYGHDSLPTLLTFFGRIMLSWTVAGDHPVLLYCYPAIVFSIHLTLPIDKISCPPYPTILREGPYPYYFKVRGMGGQPCNTAL